MKHIYNQNRNSLVSKLLFRNFFSTKKCLKPKANILLQKRALLLAFLLRRNQRRQYRLVEDVL